MAGRLKRLFFTIKFDRIGNPRVLRKLFAVIWVVTFLLLGPYLEDTVAKATANPTVEEKFPGLASGILKSAKLAKMKSGVLLTADGVQINESLISDIVEKVEPKLREQLKKNLFFLVEQEATKKILVNKAKAAGIATGGVTEAQVIQAYLNQKVQVVVVSEQEVKAFYNANKAMVAGMPFEQVKESIQGFLQQEKKQQIIETYVRNLGQQTDVRVNIEWVKTQYALSKDNLVDKARTSGKPTMVEFGATGCIPCDMMQPILDNLKKKYPNKLNVVFVHVREQQILGARYGIRSIPVQVFFDKNGNEVFRHKGFYPEAEVIKQLSKLGVN